jgi:hypothetical protein
MNPLLYARMILAKHGIDAAWSSYAISVAVVARLPRADDRRLFNDRIGGCGTHADLVQLAAATLKAFEKRQTPLRPPPIDEGAGSQLAGPQLPDEEEDAPDDAPGELETPYAIR